MTTAVSPVANAVVARSTFNSLRLGRTSQFVVGRLIRFWDSRNIKKNGEFMGITILLLDELDSVIHGFIPANRASHYRPDLKSGSIVKVDRFEVARCAHTYKITEHQFVIRFTPSTRICEVLTEAPVINSEKFMVRRYDHLHVLSNTNLELPDVVGEIRSVQGSDLRNDAATTRVVVRLLIEPDVTVYLSLWDEAASTFRGLLKAGDKTKSVMLVTTLAVDDGNDSATFVVFDKEMTKLTQQDAAVLALDEAANSGEENLPICLEELTDKEFVFQIRVTPFNFTPNHRTFTVSTITEDIISLTHGKEEDENILGGNEGDSGLKAPPSGPSVLRENVGEECGTTDPPEIAVTRNNRKRSRE
ncbi:hypothetical protein F2Q68_00009222 [Brassica cretica]|uniref:Replication protein A 70 kDa DNA-binding subunit B/D first OB fold domain-containing protein n=1 Tax=Brassica cretica TaxID=69181 RepID=A0A8S9KY56_BRACR|nr:hypothetical protein F2Q68_00009222 [Brassica cretica]